MILILFFLDFYDTHKLLIKLVFEFETIIFYFFRDFFLSFCLRLIISFSDQHAGQLGLLRLRHRGGLKLDKFRYCSRFNFNRSLSLLRFFNECNFTFLFIIKIIFWWNMIDGFLSGLTLHFNSSFKGPENGLQNSLH